MIGMLYNCPIFDGPRSAVVVATHVVDAEVPEGSVRVAPLAPDGTGLVTVPQVVPCVASPPGDGSAAFVPAMAWSAP